jgi:mRNA interferase MazF
MDLIFQRGDIVICVASGDYGKPRPAVVVQSDLFNPTHASITVCPITSHLVEAPLFRLLLQPNKENGIKKTSQIMVDKIMTLQRNKLQKKIGMLKVEQYDILNQALKNWLNLNE